MANTETWVGLDTNATAGRNEILCDERGSAVIEIFVTHDSMAPIVARNALMANGQCRYAVASGLHAPWWRTQVVCSDSDPMS